MKKICIAILFALVGLVSCVSQNDLDIMYGEAYMADVEYAEKENVLKSMFYGENA